MGCFSEFNDYTGCFSLISNESSPILRLIGWAVWHLMVPFSIRQHSFLGGGGSLRVFNLRLFLEFSSHGQLV